MIALPFAAGAVKDTDALVLPRVAVTEVGTPGTVAGVTADDDADSAPDPSAFVACTVNVYAVPFVSPVTAQGLDEQDAVAPPGVAVAV